MRFRDDILRGLRLGAILLAALLIGVAAYRMLHETPAAAEPPEPPASPPAVANTPPSPAIAPANAPMMVPPPPPVSRRPSTRKLAKNSVPPTEPAVNCTPEQKPAEATEDQEKEGPDAAAEKAEAAAPEPVTGGENTPKPGSRGKRWLKAVDRFLHIGPKKDVRSQAVRQP